MAAISADKQTQQHVTTTKPLPLVHFTKHPITWIKIQTQLLLTAAVFTYFGVAMVASIYYLIFQQIDIVNAAWHTAVPNDYIRHAFRDVGEGLIGCLVGKQIIWNHYQKKRPINRIDRFEIKWHIANVKDNRKLSFLQLLATPPLVIIYAMPVFFVTLGAIWIFHHSGIHLSGILSVFHEDPPRHSSLAGKMAGTLASDWEMKLTGFISGLFFGRRPAKGVFDDLQLFFVEQRIKAGKTPHKYHPPTYVARYNEVVSSGTYVKSKAHRSFLFAATVRLGLGISILLTLYGLYVLTFIAP